MTPAWTFGAEKISKCHFEFGCVVVRRGNRSISISNFTVGTLVTVPCSHVGHIFRKRSPYKWLPGVNVVKKNAVRVAEVWLDDYKVNDEGGELNSIFIVLCFQKYYYERFNFDLVGFAFELVAGRIQR